MAHSEREKAVGTRERSEAKVLAAVRMRAPALRGVVFTRNRRVMLSLGDGGRTLRLQEQFAGAPREVLEAIGALLDPRSPRERDAARQRIGDFLRGVELPAPTRRRRRIHAGDLPHLERLQTEFDRVNETFFGGELPRVPIYLSGRMSRRNGHFATHPPEIVISRRVCEEAVEGEAEITLRHEMIHLWQQVHGVRLGHGAEFRRWAKRLGVRPRASREVRWKGEPVESSPLSGVAMR